MNVIQLVLGNGKGSLFVNGQQRPAAASLLVCVIHNGRAGQSDQLVERMGILHLIEVFVNLRWL